MSTQHPLYEPTFVASFMEQAYATAKRAETREAAEEWERKMARLYKCWGVLCTGATWSSLGLRLFLALIQRVTQALFFAVHLLNVFMQLIPLIGAICIFLTMHVFVTQFICTTGIAVERECNVSLDFRKYQCPAPHYMTRKLSGYEITSDISMEYLFIMYSHKFLLLTRDYDTPWVQWVIPKCGADVMTMVIKK
jgi:hypothetical protein